MYLIANLNLLFTLVYYSNLCLMAYKQSVIQKASKRDTDPDIVHQHLVEANGSERALDDVGDGCCGHNCRSEKDAVTTEREATSSMHLKILGTSFDPSDLSQRDMLSFHSEGRTFSSPHLQTMTEFFYPISITLHSL